MAELAASRLIHDYSKDIKSDYGIAKSEDVFAIRRVPIQYVSTASTLYGNRREKVMHILLTTLWNR